LDKGMVFTIEPGIYIPEEKLGVRIEDMFAVGQDGKLIMLSHDLPRTAEEVERAMRNRLNKGSSLVISMHSVSGDLFQR